MIFSQQIDQSINFLYSHTIHFQLAT